MQGVVNIPPDVSQDAALEHVPPTKLAYDIAAAAMRQTVFYYQVSFPHYRDPKFISAAIHGFAHLTLGFPGGDVTGKLSRNGDELFRMYFAQVFQGAGMRCSLQFTASTRANFAQHMISILSGTHT
jgi:hypothetical protein